MNCNDDVYQDALAKIERDSRCCKHCCCNLIGATGPTGPTGPTGSCECNCQSLGQLILNDGMETISNDKPTN